MNRLLLLVLLIQFTATKLSAQCDPGFYFDGVDCVECSPISNCNNIVCSNAADSFCLECEPDHYISGGSCFPCQYNASNVPSGFYLVTACTGTELADVSMIASCSVSLTESELCIGEVTYALPSTGGTWTSSDSNIASITNTGTITALASGNGFFTFNSVPAGCTEMTIPLTINPNPTVSINESAICINTTTIANPQFGGLWTSGDPSIATIDNNGIVTGVSAGVATLIFTNNATGCQGSIIIVVEGQEPIVLLQDSQICIGETTTAISNITGGTWTSGNNNVASITNSGMITGLSAGLVTFTFTSSDGCSSVETATLLVLPDPVVVFNGSTSIDIGQTTSLSPSTGGTWLSQDANIASIDNSGFVTGLSVGITSFVFQASGTDCSAESDLLIVNIPVNTFSGADGDWNNPNNWSQGDIPSNPLMEIVVLSASASFNSTESFVIGNTGELTVNAGIVLTVNNDIEILDGGTVENLGTINIAGN